MPETDPKDEEEPLQTADLDDQVWDKELVPDSWECLCINGIPMQATQTPPHNLYQ